VQGRHLLRIAGVIAMFVLFFAPRAARADELGNKQNLVFSAERLFGFYLDDQTVEVGNRSETSHFTVFGIGVGQEVSALTTPRLGVDYFITEHVTIGGNLGIVSLSGTPATTTGVLLGARVGYDLRLGHSVSFWPRGGFTYTSVSVDNEPDSWHVFALTLEAPFMLAPVENFAFSVGPCLDLGFTGSRFGPDYTEVMFGLMFGLSGWVGL
jgi:hypothetical protein